MYIYIYMYMVMRLSSRCKCIRIYSYKFKKIRNICTISEDYILLNSDIVGSILVFLTR